MKQGDGPRCSVFVGISLDGFLARPNGDLDWLDGAEGTSEQQGQEDEHGFHDFMARIDALVMGRDTYDKVLELGGWPYGQTPVVVLTHRPLPPERPAPHVEAMAGEPSDIVERLAQRDLVRLYVDGGRTIQSFMRAGLVDELVLTRLPVVIGEGIPLFGPVGGDVWLEHDETRVLSRGLVQSRYLRRTE